MSDSVQPHRQQLTRLAESSQQQVKEIALNDAGDNGTRLSLALSPFYGQSLWGTHPHPLLLYAEHFLTLCLAPGGVPKYGVLDIYLTI